MTQPDTNPDFPNASEAQKAEIKKKHRKVFTFDCDGLEVIFRKPGATEWRAFEKQVTEDPKDTSVPVENMAAQCLLWPERGQHEALFEEYPAFPNKLIGEIGSLCKGEKAEHAKKLLISLGRVNPTFG